MKKSENGFIFLCCLVYFTSYLTRNNYGATITEIVTATGISREIVGIALTGSFFTYGIGQLISGFIGDRISPKYLITIGLGATSVCNLAVGLVDNINVIIGIWCVNGFAQALLWPPLVRAMASRLSNDQFKKGCTRVNAFATIATIIIYLIVPVIITINNWHGVFTFCSLFGVAVCILWFFKTKDMEYALPVKNKADAAVQQNTKESIPTLKILFASGIIPVMFVIVMQGTLRDGITTWMPTYINDTFNLPSSFAILTTTILPVFAIISMYFTQWFAKHNKTEIHTSAWLWLICLIACSGLLIFFKSQMVISVLLMAIMTATAHGINLMLISNLPARFIKYGKVSTFSGILNSCTYIGSAVSIYGIALLSKEFGWAVTITIWGVVAIIGLVLTAIATKTTKPLMKEE